jgi:L-ascorbate metabolism protein UlaG (beta-lactamase superfamily)
MTKKSIYFVGDTGYCEIFKELKEKLNLKIDLALIPIG